MTSRLIRHCCAALVLMLPLAAQAADKPVKTGIYKAAPIASTSALVASHNWAGFYVGAHLGYLWGRTRFVDDGIVIDAGAPTNGLVGGFLGGYNWQSGSFVFGLEGDIGLSNARGNGVLLPPNSYDINWTSYFRARAGVASGSWLVFMAGGLALADFSVREGGAPALTTSATFTGWTIGLGAEYAVSRQVRARLEYLYADFGQKTSNNVLGISQAGLTGQTIRGAIIFPFGGLGSDVVTARY